MGEYLTLNYKCTYKVLYRFWINSNRTTYSEHVDCREGSTWSRLRYSVHVDCREWSTWSRLRYSVHVDCREGSTWSRLRLVCACVLTQARDTKLEIALFLFILFNFFYILECLHIEKECWLFLDWNTLI